MADAADFVDPYGGIADSFLSLFAGSNDFVIFSDVALLALVDNGVGAVLVAFAVSAVVPQACFLDGDADVALVVDVADHDHADVDGDCMYFALDMVGICLDVDGS